MANLKTREVRQGLLRKGFVHGGSKNADHEKFFYMTHGPNPRKTEVWTYLSHQSKGTDLKPGDKRSMARECRLSENEFEELVQCEDKFCGSYDKVLVKKGVRFPEHEPDGTPACRSAIRDCRVDGKAKTRI